MRVDTFIPARFQVLTAVFCLATACSATSSSSSTDTPDAVTADAPDVPGADIVAPVDWDAFFQPTAWTDDGKTRVVILHTNDLHSHLDGLGPLADYTPEVSDGDVTIGGLARIGSLIERERRDPRRGPC